MTGSSSLIDMLIVYSKLEIALNFRAMAAPAELLVCSQCGLRVERSERNALHHRRNEGRFLCDLCRRPAPKLTEAEQRKLEAYWTSRFGADELAELSAGLSWS